MLNVRLLFECREISPLTLFKMFYEISTCYLQPVHAPKRGLKSMVSYNRHCCCYLKYVNTKSRHILADLTVNKMPGTAILAKIIVDSARALKFERVFF